METSACRQQFETRPTSDDERGQTAQNRTPQACQECRRSKTKCNGIRPLCLRCQRRKTHCTWPKAPENAGTPPPSPSPASITRTSSVDAAVPVPHHLEIAIRQRLWDIFLARHHNVEFCSFIHRPTTTLETLNGEAPFLAASVASLAALYIPQDEARAVFGFPSTAALSDHYAQLATSFSHNLMGRPCVQTVQAFLILAIRELLAWKDFRAWMHAGTAIRMAQALQLGTECGGEHGPRLREIRRRTFWACFVVDRLMSFSYNQPFAVGMLPSSACVRLPCPEDAFIFEEDNDGTGLQLDDVIYGQTTDPITSQQLLHLGIGPFYVAMVRLWGNMAQMHVTGGRRRLPHEPTDPAGEFYQGSRAVADFAARLPPALRWSPENYERHHVMGQAQAFVSFSLLLQHARCVMHQEYLPQLDGQYLLGDEAAANSEDDAAGLPLGYSCKEVIDTCIDGVQTITDMALTLCNVVAGAGDEHESSRLHLQSTVAANALMTAAAVQLWIVYTQTCDECPKPVARARFLQLLQVIWSWEGHWPVASAWKETLAMLYKLYEYSYGTDPVLDFVSWETEKTDNGIVAPDQPGFSYGDVLSDPAAVCQRLHDKVRSILVHPLHASEVKKKKLRVFSQTLWQHLWLPIAFDGSDAMDPLLAAL